ncbi:DUF6634 family protein [Mesorhizobium sp. A623]
MYRFENQIPNFVLAAIRAEIDRFKSLAADIEVVSTSALPLDQMLARAHPDAPILEDWKFAFRPAPCLAGLSTGHPILVGEGQEIVTSEIHIISEELGWARSYSRWYRLGRRLDDNTGNC